MKKYLLLLFYYCFLIAAKAQTLDWANTTGGAVPDQGFSVALDQQGSVYSTGFFIGSVDFDPGTGVSLLTSNNNTSSDCYIQKVDPNGNFIWAKKFGSGGRDVVGVKIITDADNNLLITGYFYYTVDFDPGPGTFNLTSNGERDVFIVKLSPAGNFIWARSFGGVNRDMSSAIATDATGNVYTGGTFFETVDFNPGPSIYNLTSASNDEEDGYVLKLDNNGNFIWAYNIGDTGYDQTSSIKVDLNNNIVVTGSIFGTVDLNPQAGVSSYSTSLPSTFIQKLDINANLIWAKVIYGTGYNLSRDIAVSPDNEILLTGNFRSSIDLDPGPGTYNKTSEGYTDFYVIKLTSQGNFVWGHSFGGMSDEYPSSIATDENGSVYLTGQFGSVMDFNPGSGTYYLSPVYVDTFVLKLTAQGRFSLAKNVVGQGDYNYNSGNGLVVDEDKKVFVTGGFTQTADFDPGSGTLNKTANGSTYSDIFLFKWRTCFNPTTSSRSVTSCTSYTVPSGHATYNTSGTYQDTIANYLGCDSIITIYLTITPPVRSNMSVTACASYTPPSGNATYTQSGTYTDTLQTTTGCDSVLTINLTIINITASVSASNVSCNGGNNGSATATVTGGTGNYTYNWNTSPVQTTATTTNLAAGTYQVTVRDANNCSTTQSITVTEPAPITASQTLSICYGESVTVGSNTYTTSGTYTDILTTANGCDSTVTTNLTVSEPLDVTLAINGTTITVSQGNASYQWVDCNNNNQPIQGQNQQSYTFTSSGSYAVIVIEGNCSATSSCVSVLGTTTSVDGTGFSIYPNPAVQGNTTVSFEAAGQVEISIYNAIGAKLSSYKPAQGSKQLQLNTTGLAEGVYFIMLTKNNQLLGTKKLLILR